MVNPAGTAEMWTFRKLGLNKISTEKAIISTQKEISCPRHLTRAVIAPPQFPDVDHIIESTLFIHSSNVLATIWVWPEIYDYLGRNS